MNDKEFYTYLELRVQFIEQRLLKTETLLYQITRTQSKIVETVDIMARAVFGEKPTPDAEEPTENQTNTTDEPRGYS